MKKLDYFKKEILKTDQTLKLDDELHKVKLQLRAKTINMLKVHSLAPNEGLDDVLESSDLYRLPIISKKGKIYEGEREARKKKGTSHKKRHEEKKIINLQDHNSFNDKNMRI